MNLEFSIFLLLPPLIFCLNFSKHYRTVLGFFVNDFESYGFHVQEKSESTELKAWTIADQTEENNCYSKSNLVFFFSTSLRTFWDERR